MPIRTNIAVPECPSRVPLIGVLPPNDCIPGSSNWNKLVSSQKFLQQAGVVIFEASSQRNNGASRPCMGDFGNTFNEAGVPSYIQQMTTPIELLPGLNKGILIANMKLANIGAMNQTLEFILTRGAAQQTIASFRAVAGSGFITGMVTIGTGNILYTTAIPFTINSAIVPQAGETEQGTVVIAVRKFQPRGVVTGAGADYWDGLGHIVIKQYKDCP